jgi:hypothetical protein
VARLPNPFSFLFARSQKEELMAEYLVREHHRGRDLADILDDAHVKNHLNEDQIKRLLDRPEVIQALGEDTVSRQRSEL